jgi:hypothetical protein
VERLILSFIYGIYFVFPLAFAIYAAQLPDAKAAAKTKVKTK